MTTTPPRIDPRLGAAALRAPAASMVDSRPQAILKLRPRNSFDYRVRYEPQPIWDIISCPQNYTVLLVALDLLTTPLSQAKTYFHVRVLIQMALGKILFFPIFTPKHDK